MTDVYNASTILSYFLLASWHYFTLCSLVRSLLILVYLLKDLIIFFNHLIHLQILFAPTVLNKSLSLLASETIQETKVYYKVLQNVIFPWIPNTSKHEEAFRSDLDGTKRFMLSTSKPPWFKSGHKDTTHSTTQQTIT